MKGHGQMILDQYGKPLVRYERRAIGFVARTLPDTDNDPPCGVLTEGTNPTWLEACDGDYFAPYARKETQ